MLPYQKDNRFFACGNTVFVKADNAGETHVYDQNNNKLTERDITFGEVYGGGENTDFSKTNVIMLSGFVKTLSGGGIGGNIESASVTLENGSVGDNIYGAGIGDTVESAKICINAGTVKHGIYGAGRAQKCGKVDITLNGGLSIFVFTGGESPDTYQCGKSRIDMRAGHFLGLICGGHGKNEGGAEITVSGGEIEREISYKKYEGELKLRLYKNLFVSNGLNQSFPYLPENAQVEYLPEVDKKPMPAFGKTNADLFTTEKGKLNLIFFELRHPKVPKNASPFPPFIGCSDYLEFPNGENMLFDSGNDYNAAEITENLKKLGVTHLDNFVVTHFHKDHIGCADMIINNFGVKRVFLPDIVTVPGADDMPFYERMKTAISENSPEVILLSRGDSFIIGTGRKAVSVFCLNPQKGFGGEMNDCSVALKFTYNESSVILGGDMGEIPERELVSAFGDFLKCDLLKVSHHGIVYQSYHTYIDACSPSAVIIDTLREQGIFAKITTSLLHNVNKIPRENIFITGKVGAIKTVFSGAPRDIKTEYQYTF
ncbi:MAG: MBL fold metallo-hydrolase [Clostridiales bacterium]|nr:MBL fold metallo-hydrolase [Candidatus Equinaster intestinalis]